ncbi:putative immunoglobulin-blocking virulence protein [Ureaplasma sp. ES3154-GEN]|uniref:putative immunoglobulin-blocking virulence protein n=1 Tax=Ureaplasma sp. ES3154-GEN TaxID=2984844 RepID=UPI0021E99780|nr:putative immunoglobulin-blocking virulence protein [Ureaplasma sp. ES3154-GEN]MCV3743325.1 putative immunoglobulin-blocking virulence protein [Ureaplasma sp. ES3154-GEN]
MKLKHKLALSIIATTAVIASTIAATLGLNKHSATQEILDPRVQNADFYDHGINEINISKPITPAQPNTKINEHNEDKVEITDKLEIEEVVPPSTVPEVEIPKEPEVVPEVPKEPEVTPAPEEPILKPEEKPSIEEILEPIHEITKEDELTPKDITETELPKDLQVFPPQIEKDVEVDGLTEKVTLQPQPNRLYFKSDEEAGIVNKNPDPYLSERVPDVVNFDPSKEFIKKQVDKSTSYFKKNTFSPTLEKDYVRNATQENLAKYFLTNGHNEYDRNDFSRDNPFLSLSDKYWRLIWYGNWEKYVIDGTPPEKIQELKNLPQDPLPQTPKSVAKIIKIVSYLDFDKFTTLSKDAEKAIRDGHSLDDSNSYIDEKGEINSYSSNPLPGTNKVTSRLEYDNANRRIFGYSSYYNRTPQNLIDGTYEGWTKTVDTEYNARYNSENIDGINFDKLTRNNPENDKRNEGRVLTIDVSKQGAYERTVNVIEKLKQDNVTIEGYRFLNIGSKDANQAFVHIIKALPKKILQLEFFFVKKDTSALAALEEKEEIKELGLYTNELPYDEAWRINPWALKNVHWINTNDYNSPSGYGNGYHPWTRIQFTSLAFYQSDVKENEKSLALKLNRINYGLRMAYFVRNNEPFFQGEMGSGLKPDHNQGGNSYPWGLDLSRTSLKSLRGLVFQDHKKPENGTRKLKYLWLRNDTATFEITTDELNHAQFKEIMIQEQPQMPRTKIFFSNNEDTKRIKVIKGTEPLNSEGIANLRVLREYTDSSGVKNNPVLYNAGDEETKQILQSNFAVQEDNPTANIDVA